VLNKEINVFFFFLLFCTTLSQLVAVAWPSRPSNSLFVCVLKGQTCFIDIVITVHTSREKEEKHLKREKDEETVDGLSLKLH
jgi:hypothetical protein